MPTAKLFNMAGDQVGEVALSEAVFGVEPNESVLHDSVKNHRPCTRRRQGQPGVDPRRRRVCAEAA